MPLATDKRLRRAEGVELYEMPTECDQSLGGIGALWWPSAAEARPRG